MKTRILAILKIEFDDFWTKNFYHFVFFSKNITDMAYTLLFLEDIFPGILVKKNYGKIFQIGDFMANYPKFYYYIF